MSLLSDILKGQKYVQGSTYTGPSPLKSYSSAPVVPAGAYSTPYVAPTPVQNQAPTPAPAVVAPVANRPIFQGTPTPTPTEQPVDLYAKYRDPLTGKIMTPKEYALYLTKKLPSRSSDNKGDIGTYVGNKIMNPDASATDLKTTARGLEAAQGDLAVGQTDPYGNKAIPYSPEERRAIENAYAGIYDPAIKDVYAKLEAKQAAEKEKASQDFDLIKLAKQHEYTMAEKSLTGGTGGYAGVYTPGNDSTVDSYVQRINNGEITEKDAMAQLTGVKNTSLRSSISSALSQTRNQNVKYTSSMNDVNSINNLLSNPELSDITGMFDQFYPAWATTGDEAKARALLSNLGSNLQLAKSGSLQGQGAVSDYERSLVKEAATGLLARNLSKEDFENSLIQYRAGLMLINNESVPVEMTKGNESHPVVATRKDIADAIRDGWVIKYLK